MKRPNYDRFPRVEVPGGAGTCVSGWDAIADRLAAAVTQRGSRRTVLVVECYPGVHEDDVRRELEHRLHPVLSLRAADLLLPPDVIARRIEPFLGGGDPVFGRLTDLALGDFFDPGRVARAASLVHAPESGLVLIVGCGAGLVHEGDLLVQAELARWEAQQRFRRRETINLGAVDPADPAVSAAQRYQRSYFVDWRVADRWKQERMARWDFVLDTNQPATPRLADAATVRRALRHATTRPFRVVPYFDPAPWGGQWLGEAFSLPAASPNYGWGFDCVPEENSLLLGLGDTRLELPAQDLVLAEPRRLLGGAVHDRFGAEFPIRFDLLDTLRGGPLSFQVHPLTDYIRRHFGMPYTQDESYYLLAAGPDASVYLGLRDGVDPAAFARELTAAQAGGPPFDPDRHANRWPARRHDHFLIPAGTVHCSGADAVVLEISATPYIFTFKLWDWGRLGLDGRPRPIHLGHGLDNIRWERTTAWTRQELINRIEPLAYGDGWREERTGLHPTEFIETRRHWFTRAVPHDTAGGVHVLNLVQGDEAVVESPTEAFAPFVVHFAETFIVPAAVGRYRIRPSGAAADPGAGECATIQASVRTGPP